MVQDSAIISPRLRAIDPASAGSIGTFWREIEAVGAPLIEPDPDTPGVSLVTFLWRATEPVENVVVIEWLTAGDFLDKQMARLGESDIWYRTIRARSDLRTDYKLSPNDSLVPKRQEADWETRRAGWVIDPLNPKRFKVDANLPEPERSWIPTSILELPDAPAFQRPANAGAPRGDLTDHRFQSAILDNERTIRLYVPVELMGTESPGLLLHFDGERAEDVLDVPQLVDSLIAQGAIAPLVVVMVDNVDRGSELPCNADFVRFLATELVPWVREQVGCSADPARTIVAGQSYGGLASAWAALQHPEVFGNVLSQSGSFWWKPDPFSHMQEPVPGDVPEYCWLNTETATRPRVPVRFWMDAGTLENRSGNDAGPSLLQSNRWFRDVLVAKGYEVTYSEFPGGHDYLWWRERLADGLAALASQ